MKTNYFKAFATTITLVFAVATSVITHASEEKTHAILPAYASINGGPCSLVNYCNSSGFQYCTITSGGNIYQIFGKITPWDTICPIILYKN